MSSARILALSSSRVGNAGFLETALPLIKNFLGDQPLNIAFIPFASVGKSYRDYHSMVEQALETLQHTIQLVEPTNAKTIIEQSDVIMIGGGNTFKLLHDIYAFDLLDLIKQKVNNGNPYVGWSAGSNITGASISTTNDMPIIEPKSFKSFNFFPFQLNPHYLNVKPEGHNGETRDERLTEFITLNATVPVVGLPEGAALLLEEKTIIYKGKLPGVIFHNKDNAVIKEEITDGKYLTYLIR